MNLRQEIVIPMIGVFVLALAVPVATAQNNDREARESHRELLSRRIKEINRAIRSNQPGNEEDILDDPIHANLTRVLVTELNFIRKVCEPDSTDFTAIAKEGVEWVRDFPAVGRTLSLGEPDLRILVTGVLAESVERHLPDSSAAIYREEIDARMAARNHAVAALITSLVNQDAVLSVDQFNAIESSLYKRWKPDWPDVVTIALNDLNAVLPGWSSAKVYLSPVQQELWRYRGKQKSRDPGRAVQYNPLNLFDVELDAPAEIDIAEIDIAEIDTESSP